MKVTVYGSSEMKKTFVATVVAAMALTACNGEDLSQKVKVAEEKATQLEATLSAKDIDLSQLQQSYEKLKEEFDRLKSSVSQKSFPALEVTKDTIFSHEETIRDNDSQNLTDITVVAKSLQTEFDWLNQILLRYLLAATQDDTENYRTIPESATREQVEHAFSSIDQQFKAQVKEFQPPYLARTAELRYLGQKGYLVFFALDTYQIEGGAAHGMSLTHYINVDADSKAVIGLNDLFSKTALANVKKHLWEAYQERLQRLNTEATVSQQEFRVSDNFYFGANGLVFVYPPYELAAYAEGSVELTLDYSLVNELLNKKYQQ